MSNFQLKQYDVDDPELQSGPALLKEGIYIVNPRKVDVQDTSKGGKMLVIEYEVIEGEMQGAYVLGRYNVENQNELAEKIAYAELARLSKAQKMQRTPADPSAFIDKPVKINVKTEQGKPYLDKKTNEMKDGRDQNVIKDYFPIASETATPSAAQSGAATPAQPVETQASTPEPQAAVIDDDDIPSFE